MSPFVTLACNTASLDGERCGALLRREGEKYRKSQGFRLTLSGEGVRKETHKLTGTRTRRPTPCGVGARLGAPISPFYSELRGIGVSIPGCTFTNGDSGDTENMDVEETAERREGRETNVAEESVASPADEGRRTPGVMRPAIELSRQMSSTPTAESERAGASAAVFISSLGPSVRMRSAEKLPTRWMCSGVMTSSSRMGALETPAPAANSGEVTTASLPAAGTGGMGTPEGGRTTLICAHFIHKSGVTYSR